MRSPPDECEYFITQGTLEQCILAVKAAMETSRGHIVASPKRLRDDLEAAIRLRESAQTELVAAEDECRALEMRQEVVVKAERDVRKGHVLLAEVEVRNAAILVLPFYTNHLPGVAARFHSCTRLK